MLRNIIGVIAGVIVGMIFNMALVILDTALYPMPEGVDFNDAEGMAAYMTQLPLPALLIILIAHIGHAFVGGLVAAAISRNAVMAVAMIVGVLTLIAGVINMMSMPLPTWMWIEVPLYLVAAWVAGRIVLGWRAGKHPGEDSNFRPAD